MLIMIPKNVTDFKLFEFFFLRHLFTKEEKPRKTHVFSIFKTNCYYLVSRNMAIIYFFYSFIAQYNIKRS